MSERKKKITQVVPVCAGFLMKMHRRQAGSWSRRYLRLQNSSLAYFYTADEQNDFRWKLRCLDVARVTILPDGKEKMKHVMCITAADGSEIFFAAKTHDEIKHWVDCIQEEIRKAWNSRIAKANEASAASILGPTSPHLRRSSGSGSSSTASLAVAVGDGSSNGEAPADGTLESAASAPSSPQHGSSQQVTLAVASSTGSGGRFSEEEIVAAAASTAGIAVAPSAGLAAAALSNAPSAVSAIPPAKSGRPADSLRLRTRGLSGSGSNPASPGSPSNFRPRVGLDRATGSLNSPSIGSRDGKPHKRRDSAADRSPAPRSPATPNSMLVQLHVATASSSPLASAVAQPSHSPAPSATPTPTPTAPSPSSPVGGGLSLATTPAVLSREGSGPAVPGSPKTTPGQVRLNVTGGLSVPQTGARRSVVSPSPLSAPSSLLEDPDDESGPEDATASAGTALALPAPLPRPLSSSAGVSTAAAAGAGASQGSTAAMDTTGELEESVKSLSAALRQHLESLRSVVADPQGAVGQIIQATLEDVFRHALALETTIRSLHFQQLVAKDITLGFMDSHRERVDRLQERLHSLSKVGSQFAFAVLDLSAAGSRRAEAARAFGEAIEACLACLDAVHTYTQAQWVLEQAAASGDATAPVGQVARIGDSDASSGIPAAPPSIPWMVLEPGMAPLAAMPSHLSKDDGTMPSSPAGSNSEAPPPASLLQIVINPASTMQLASPMSALSPASAMHSPYVDSSAGSSAISSLQCSTSSFRCIPGPSGESTRSSMYEPRGSVIVRALGGVPEKGGVEQPAAASAPLVSATALVRQE